MRRRTQETALFDLGRKNLEGASLAAPRRNDAVRRCSSTRWSRDKIPPYARGGLQTRMRTYLCRSPAPLLPNVHSRRVRQTACEHPPPRFQTNPLSISRYARFHHPHVERRRPPQLTPNRPPQSPSLPPAPPLPSSLLLTRCTIRTHLTTIASARPPQLSTQFGREVAVESSPPFPIFPNPHCCRRERDDHGRCAHRGAHARL